MSQVIIAGDTSGTITLQAPAVSGSSVLTLPATTATLATLTTPSFASTIGVGGATASASGAGISFPATQSASSDANTLDDYERGTFTPTQGSGLTVTGTFTSSGVYVKIGKMVYVNLRLGATNILCSSGGEMTTNLPFAIASSPGNAMGISANSNNFMSLAYGYLSTIYCGATALPTGSGAIFITIAYTV